MRKKLNLDDLAMGVYSTGLENFMDETLSFSNIWVTSERHSIQLHSRLKSNQDLKNILCVEDFFQFLIENQAVFDSGEKSDLFTFSNLGILNNKLNGSSKIKDVFHIKEHYFSMPCLESRYSALFFNGICTVNKQLCWSMSFNDKYFSKIFISNLKENILNLINSLII